MNNKIKTGLQNNYSDAPLFLAITAWVITAGSLVYVFANLGTLRAIIFTQYLNHSLVSATCLVLGVLGMFCLCCALAKVVFRSGYKQFSKKGF